MTGNKINDEIVFEQVKPEINKSVEYKRWQPTEIEIVQDIKSEIIIEQPETPWDSKITEEEKQTPISSDASSWHFPSIKTEWVSSANPETIK